MYATCICPAANQVDLRALQHFLCKHFNLNYKRAYLLVDGVRFSKHIIFFGRYINHVIIWSKMVEEFESFVYCNNNVGLKFTYVINPTSLIILDLELTHKRGSIITKNFCKSVGGNSYLSE